MEENKADLILHPVRLRMMLALAGRQLTVSQLAELLPDVPQATLYRHLNKLVKTGLVVKVGERPVRGTLEKLYALEDQGFNLSDADFANSSREDHLRYFVTFVSSLIGDFSRYLQRKQLNFLEDGVGYTKGLFYMTDEEFISVATAIGQAFEPVRMNPPGEGRSQRIFATVILPADPPRDESSSVKFETQKGEPDEREY